MHTISNLTSRSPKLLSRLRTLCHLCEQHSVTISTRFLPSVLNCWADRLSRRRDSYRLDLPPSALFHSPAGFSFPIRWYWMATNFPPTFLPTLSPWSRHDPISFLSGFGNMCDTSQASWSPHLGTIIRGSTMQGATPHFARAPSWDLLPHPPRSSDLASHRP